LFYRDECPPLFKVSRHRSKKKRPSWKKIIRSCRIPLVRRNFIPRVAYLLTRISVSTRVFIYKLVSGGDRPICVYPVTRNVDSLVYIDFTLNEWSSKNEPLSNLFTVLGTHGAFLQKRHTRTKMKNNRNFRSKLFVRRSVSYLRPIVSERRELKRYILHVSESDVPFYYIFSRFGRVEEMSITRLTGTLKRQTATIGWIRMRRQSTTAYVCRDEKTGKSYDKRVMRPR